MWNRRKNGEEYPQLLSIRAVREEGGEVESYVAVCHDISERKEARTGSIISPRTTRSRVCPIGPI